MLRRYLSNLYTRTMASAYAAAHDAIAECVRPGAKVLDCGAAHGYRFEVLEALCGLSANDYAGIEWDAGLAEAGRGKGLNVIEGDLNKKLPFADGTFDCVFGLSVVEHILMPCHYLVEAKRVLKPGGRLVILTPNIATYFTAFQLLLGRMPSTGPHPDSQALIETGGYALGPNEEFVEGETPQHRHLVVFSYAVLGRYLRMLGFRNVKGRGFGHYPAPLFLQPLLQKIDPWHCHQLVFVADV